MKLDPLRVLSHRIRFASVLLMPLLLVYILMTFGIFSEWVAPSLDGRTDQHIAADSTTYIYFADTLREGLADPFVIGAMTTFPNNFWCPVLLALIIKSTLVMVFVNYIMAVVSVLLLRETLSVSTWRFLALLLLNATTTVSLLAVNKEIVDVLAVSIFLFSYHRRNRILLLLALALALFNRFETCLVMAVFICLKSRLNPMRRRRILTIFLLTVGLSILLPLAASKVLAQRFEEASSAGFVNLLDQLEMHYLYVLAVIPKILENFFGELLNISKLSSYSFSDPANSYFLLSNDLASAIVFVILALRRKLSLNADIIYFAAIGCIIMAISLVIQPRYFYAFYVLLCLQAAHTESSPTSVFSPTRQTEFLHA